MEAKSSHAGAMLDEPAGQAVRAVQDVAFGSIAGILGKFIEYPFDTVKVRLQSQPSNAPALYAGPVDCFRQAIVKDGVIYGLYRGVSAPLVGAAIETSSLFFSYRLAQDFLRSTVYCSLPPDSSSSAPPQLPMTGLCVAGAASGAFTSLLLTPIELVKCKMQVPSNSSTNAAPGIMQIISNVTREQGLLGFWRGQLGTLVRETGGSAAWFGSYEGVSLLFRKRREEHRRRLGEGVSDTSDAPLAVWQQLLAGASAGMAYNFSFYPADTIKSRMQTEDFAVTTPKDAFAAGQQRPKSQTFWTVGKELWREMGLRGLYRGCGITVARAAPSSAVVFTIFEALKRHFS